MNRINFCPACSAEERGVKTRIALEHTCEKGLHEKQINNNKCQCVTYLAMNRCKHYRAYQCCREEDLLAQKKMEVDSDNGASFSECGTYRYLLWRIWDQTRPLIMFIGLNPSTANATTDDPTIRRVKQIASNLGYGGVYMMNLFAIVSSDPTILKTCSDPLADNDVWLRFHRSQCDKIVFAWGNFKEAEERSKHVIRMFPNAFALHINKNGSPKHPLYCKSDSQLKPFTNESSTKSDSARGGHTNNKSNC